LVRGGVDQGKFQRGTAAVDNENARFHRHWDRK
jgi:hypothetical protein